MGVLRCVSRPASGLALLPTSERRSVEGRRPEVGFGAAGLGVDGVLGAPTGFEGVAGLAAVDVGVATVCPAAGFEAG